MKTLLLALLRFYRTFISPLLGLHCRFHPSCSCYAQEAVMRFGAFHGTVLATRRLCKCHPFHPGGFDPVPEQLPQKTTFINKFIGL